jgi:hypothetical protein
MVYLINDGKDPLSLRFRPFYSIRKERQMSRTQSATRQFVVRVDVVDNGNDIKRNIIDIVFNLTECLRTVSSSTASI